MKTQSRSLFTMLPMLLAIFIDGMGIAILFPVLNDIIMNPADSILPFNASMSDRNFAYGLTLGTFFIAWFFGTAVISDLSDRAGRKNTLLICLTGSGIGYVFAAIAIAFKSLPLLLIGRIIDGFTIGSQPIAQAAIIDISTPQTKTRNIALTLLAPSLGFVVGPLIGGMAADKTLVSWFSPAVPMWFAASLSFLNALMLWLWFKDTHTNPQPIRISLKRAFEVFYSAFTHHQIRYLSAVLLFIVLAWSSFFSFISVYLLDRFHTTLSETGFYMAVIGVGFGIGSGVLTRLVNQWMTQQQGIVICTIITCIGIALTLTANSTAAIYIGALIIGSFGMVGYSIMINLLSNEADENSQGWIMGITDSIAAAAFISTTLLESLLIHLSSALPLMFSVGFYIVSIGLLTVRRSAKSVLSNME